MRDYRAEIKSENMMEDFEQARCTKRNKEVVRDYVNGMTYEQLSERYGVTKPVIAHAARSYIQAVKRLRNERKKEEKRKQYE